MIPSDSFSLTKELEKAILVIHGDITFEWNENKVSVRRSSFFNENPTLLLVPSKVQVKIFCGNAESELCIVETKNER